MDKKRFVFLKRVIPQILVQSIAIMITAVCAYFFMTWIIITVAKVESTYLAASYVISGTLFLMIVVLVSTNTYLYQKRLKEVEALSRAITKVASGEYGYTIALNKEEPMTQVYEDFNKMSTELSRVRILQNDFIDRYSHEFKTPIASINGFASLLLEKNVSQEEKKQYLEIIRDESNRLSTLAKNTILLSRLSSQQIVANMEKYNLGEQLRQCSIICSKNWIDKDQDFNGNFPDIFIVGNRELLQHLWLNLLGNSIKYTPEGGEISITLKRHDQNIVVTFSDTGEGMTEETMQHLFSPYYQGDSSRSTQGLGLGLSISKRIVELFSGTITVKSELNSGSEFKVTLPMQG